MYTRHQRGAVAPLVALLLFVIIICVALVVDLGRVHSVKAELQRAVDAAALAGAKYLPDATNVTAASTATAGTNRVDGDKFENQLDLKPLTTELHVVLGQWDKDALGDDAADRFTTGGSNPDAVYVKASYDVDHTFFFFTDSTTVIADAIALAQPSYPILPLAMISCIPTDVTSQPLGTLPDMSICGVAGLGPNTGSDLSAWTSLVLTPNSETTNEYILQQSDGIEVFNQIVFERGIEPTGSGGLENSPVVSVPGSFDPDFTGCINDQSLSSIVAGAEINISCGLGGVNNKNIAPPGDYENLPFVSSIPALNTATLPSGNTYYAGNPSFDPLTGYSLNNNPLPRWYNINNNTGFDEDDHIIRIATLDGILIKGPTETDAEYKQRLLDLKNGVLASPYAGVDGTVNRFETFITGNNPSNVEVDFLETLAYAGYPRVNVTEGVGSVLGEFLARVYNVATKQDVDGPMPCDENTTPEITPSPYNEDQLISVRLNVPVIFAGSCEKWKTNPSTMGYYIGMAKFLMTRSMLTNEMFACGSPTNATSAGCSGFDDPTLDSLGFFGLDPVDNFNSPAMIEGLFALPTTDDDDDSGGLVEIFLVE